MALSDISSCICDSTGQLNKGMGMTGKKYGLNNNLTSSILSDGETDWNSIDQRQRIIQNVVRVPASQYTVNISALNVFDPSQNSGETGSNFSGPSDRGYPSGYMNYSTAYYLVCFAILAPMGVLLRNVDTLPLVFAFIIHNKLVDGLFRLYQLS